MNIQMMSLYGQRFGNPGSIQFHSTPHEDFLEMVKGIQDYEKQVKRGEFTSTAETDFYEIRNVSFAGLLTTHGCSIFKSTSDYKKFASVAPIATKVLFGAIYSPTDGTFEDPFKIIRDINRDIAFILLYRGVKKGWELVGNQVKIEEDYKNLFYGLMVTPQRLELPKQLRIQESILEYVVNNKELEAGYELDLFDRIIQAGMKWIEYLPFVSYAVDSNNVLADYAKYAQGLVSFIPKFCKEHGRKLITRRIEKDFHFVVGLLLEFCSEEFNKLVESIPIDGSPESFGFNEPMTDEAFVAGVQWKNHFLIDSITECNGDYLLRFKTGEIVRSRLVTRNGKTVLEEIIHSC